MKILVIDGHKEIANLLCEYLTNKGNQCVALYDGRNGLESLENNEYDMTLMELNLPELDGYDIINTLEKTGRIHNQNIVILTASNQVSENEIAELKKQGVKRFLKKPVEIDMILKELLQSNKNNNHELKQRMPTVGGSNALQSRSVKKEFGPNDKIKELEQQIVMLQEIKEDYKQKGKKLEEKLDTLQSSAMLDVQKEKESTQVKLLSETIVDDEHKRRLRTSKRFYILIAIIGVGVASGVIGYSHYENQIFLETASNILTSYKTGYLVQNLRGDVVNTWVAWDIPSDRILYVNIQNAAGVSEDKINAVKDVILSEKTIQLDDSLLHKGPPGSVSTYYEGWQGALDEASKANTQYYIPLKFEVTESNAGNSDVTITLSTDSSPDGYTGFTKSISDQNRVLRAETTIFDTQNLSVDQLKAIVRHEFGHVMGLAHSTAPEDLMHATIQTQYPYISDCDIGAIDVLYNGGQHGEFTCLK
jgi:CheY-like chemotaxis protein